MIEMYLAASLLGIGYIFNKINSENVQVPENKQEDIRSLQPSKGNFIPKTRVIERQHVEETRKEAANVNKKLFRSELLNEDIYVDKVHNNMVPFFSGSSTGQNVDVNANIGILERFGVNNEHYQPKKEIAPMFELRPNMPINTRETLDNMYDRTYISKIQNNVLPFEQVKVGPGLGKEYSSKPSGGFHQDSTELILKDIPTVDSLRAKNNPKKTFKGRVVDGMKERKRPTPINMTTNENKVLVKQRTQDDLFKTTGAVLKTKQHPKPINKETNRQTCTREVFGNPHNSQAGKVRAKVQEPHKINLGTLPAGIATLTDIGNKVKEDYGKSSIQVYSNERDITSTRTYQGNVTSAIKSIVAPLQDLVKHSKKEYYVEHAREFGNMSIQIPEKQVVKDPNDVMRTTIKETTIHNNHNLNLKGGAFKSIAYDPNSVARTTIKETTIHNTKTGNIRVFEKTEARSENATARVTNRQTLDNVDTNVNLNSVEKGITTYPDDIAKTTIKQTTLSKPQLGNVQTLDQFNAAYENLDMEAKMTMKETYEENEYLGVADQTNADGYVTAKVDPKTTLREESTEYFGTAVETGAKREIDTVGVMENSEQNEIRPLTDVQREPTFESVKVASGTDTVNVDVKKIEAEVIPTDYQDRIINKMTDECFAETTKNKQDIEELNTRLDTDILAPFKNNPYTQPLPES